MASSLRYDGSRRCDGYWAGGNLSGVRGILHCEKEETFAPVWKGWYLSLQNDSEGRAFSFGLTFSPNITLILINKSAALVGGAAAVTCYAPVSYISAIIILLLQGVSDGCQPLISLSYGEGRHDRTKQFRNLAYSFAAAVSLLCMGVLFLLRGQAAALFGASPQITARVADILPVFLSGYLFVSISRVTTAYFYATDKTCRPTL